MATQQNTKNAQKNLILVSMGDNEVFNLAIQLAKTTLFLRFNSQNHEISISPKPQIHFKFPQSKATPSQQSM
jgi:hypothetical protein